MSGIEKGGTIDVLADASLVIGFMALATLAVCSWIGTTAFSDDEIFYPFLLVAWLAHFGLDKRAIGPFAFHERQMSFSAPQGFYFLMTIAAAVLLIFQIVNGSSNANKSEDAHPIRSVAVLLWTLVYGLALIGDAWRWVSSSQLSGLQAIPLGRISAFGWLCAIVGALIYGTGFVGFMTWMTKGKWKTKLQEDLQ